MPDLSLERDAIGLFERALDIPDADRAAWLDAECAGRPDLRARVADMLEADRAALLRTGAASQELEEDVPPERIGAYRIVERIGRGGMGSVYRGERMTGDFAHVVAIKIIKPGLLSETLVERFKRERQLLAALSHPNIAQLYDGGETDAGSPYIVMEHVDGLPLLEWVEGRGLSLAARQSLFRAICGAVAAAHRNLIVHRDLTPSNVLVTHDGVVKLIDFGIARPPAEAGAEAVSGKVSVGSLSLTPGYAAPERISSHEVTTAADIYSLGKLLAKLVPEDARGREAEAIIAKATAHDPLDRYSSADALDADVAAWAQIYPVEAVGAGRRYRLSRYVQRHVWGVAAAAAALVMIAAAFALTVRAYTEAESARDAEAQRFEDVRSLATYMLFDLDDRLRRVPGNAAARADLAQHAQTYLDQLAASPLAGRDVRLETVLGLIRLAEIQGSPLDRNLGLIDHAKGNLDKARALVERVRGEQGGGADLDAAAARIEALAAMIAFHQEGKSDAAKASLERAQAVLDAVPEPSRDDNWHRAQRDVSRSAVEFLLVDEQMDGLRIAVARYRAALAAWPASMRTGDALRIEEAIADYHEGAALAFGDRKVDAAALLRRAAQTFITAERARPNDPDLLYWIGWSGIEAFQAAERNGEGSAAVGLLEAAQSAASRLGTVTDEDRSARTLWRAVNEAYALHLAQSGRGAQAIALQRDIIESRIRANGADPEGMHAANLGYSKMMLGVIAKASGDRALACDSWTQADNHFQRAERDGALIGYHEAFLPGLRRNLAACRAGTPLSAMGDIR